NPDNYGWFNIFTILFEIVSAYGTVGLSLGIPDQNYSFSGACRTLTKLIVILVMLRGRHRGLPVAIDRAVMLRGYDFPDALEQHHPDNATIPRSDADDRSRGRTADLKSVGETNEKLSFRDGYQNGVPGSTPLTASALAVHLMTRPSEGDAEITQKEKGRLDPVPETTRHSRDATQMSHSDDDEIHDLKS
ncbi:low affinity potassium transporter, partial [Tulasnella sp. 403]